MPDKRRRNSAQPRVPDAAPEETIPEGEGPFLPPMVPPWELLPDDFKRQLGFLQRWAATLDGAPKRCPRRECRRFAMCHAAPSALAFLCDGVPSARAGHWTTGMWLAHSLKLDELWLCAEDPATSAR